MRVPIFIQRAAIFSMGVCSIIISSKIRWDVGAAFFAFGFLFILSAFFSDYKQMDQKKDEEK